MTTIRELAIAVGFDVDKRSMAGAENAIDTVKKAGAKLIELFAGPALAYGLQRIVSTAVEIGSRLNDTAEQLGFSTTGLQQMQFAARMAGVRAEQFSAGMSQLSRQLFAAGEGSKEARKFFREFGIDVFDSSHKLKSAEAVLGDVADAIQREPVEAKKAGIALKMFGRAGLKLLPILKDGRKGLEEQARALDRIGGPITAETIKALDDLGDQTDATHQAFDRLKVAIAEPLLRPLTWITEKIGTFVGWLVKVAEKSQLVQSALAVLGTFFGILAIKALLPFAPLIAAILLVGAVLGGIILIVDDFWTALNGGKSFFLDFMNDFINGAKEGESVWLTLTRLMAYMIFHAPGEALAWLWEKFQQFGKWVSEDLVGFFKSAGAWIADNFLNPIGAFLDNVVAKFKAVGGFVGNVWEKAKGLLPSAAGAFQDYVRQDTYAQNDPAANGLIVPPELMGGGSNVTTTNNVTAQVTVNAPQGADPDALMAAAREQFTAELGKSLSDARAVTVPRVAR